MEIILLEKIRNLGDVGQVVNVKDGYGRNFLIKFWKALRADKKNIEFVNKKRTEINKKNSEQKKIAKEVYEKIKKKLIVFGKETKENGDLYGAIKPKEISKYFLDNFFLLSKTLSNKGSSINSFPFCFKFLFIFTKSSIGFATCSITWNIKMLSNFKFSNSKHGYVSFITLKFCLDA